MRFRLKLQNQTGAMIPVNYQYPLSSAIYRILQRADEQYSEFLHKEGYGKGFKLFTFSDLKVPFKINGDRMHLLGNEVLFEIAFHLPEASQNFIKGLFLSQKIDIADNKSKASFTISSVESLPNPLQQYKENEIVNIRLRPISPIVAGLQNEKGNYDFLSPEDSQYTESIIYNWRNKIATCYDAETASEALLIAEIIKMIKPFKSRLITIKDGTDEATKIRGWSNFGLKVTAEKRFVELLLNCGAGVYNAQGMGCVSGMRDEDVQIDRD